MRNYNSSGDIVKTISASDRESGSFVKIGAVYGFVVDDAKAGEYVVVKTEGVFEVAGISALEFGTPIYHHVNGTLDGVEGTDPDTLKVGVVVGPGLLKLT